jgi:hypothetical protein
MPVSMAQTISLLATIQDRTQKDVLLEALDSYLEGIKQNDPGLIAALETLADIQDRNRKSDFV